VRLAICDYVSFSGKLADMLSHKTRPYLSQTTSSRNSSMDGQRTDGYNHNSKPLDKASIHHLVECPNKRTRASLIWFSTCWMSSMFKSIVCRSSYWFVARLRCFSCTIALEFNATTLMQRHPRNVHGVSKKYRDYRNISRKGRATVIKFGVHLEGTLPDIHARALSCASTQSEMAYLRVEGCWGCPAHFRFSSNAFATALRLAVEDVWMGKNVVEDDWWVHMSRIQIKTGCQCFRSSRKFIASVSVLWECEASDQAAPKGQTFRFLYSVNEFDAEFE